MNPRHLGLFIISAFIALTLPFQSNGQQVIFVARHVDTQKLLRMDAPIRDDTPLSESGRRHAGTFAERLKDAGITAIYTCQWMHTGRLPTMLAESRR